MGVESRAATQDNMPPITDGTLSWWYADSEVTHERLMEVLGNDFDVRMQNFLAAKGIVIPQDSPYWHHPPKLHEKSNARYPLDEYPILHQGRSDLLYISILPPGAESSEHRHPRGVYEVYESIVGSVAVNGLFIPERGMRMMSWGVWHQAQAAPDSWAVMFIQSINGGSVPRERLHEYRNGIADPRR